MALSKYRLSSGLWTVKEEPEFETDQEAWEALRVMLPGKFATLYKKIEFEVPINNREEYIRIHNAKYTTQLIEKNTESYNDWIPVLVGITDDPFNVD